MIEAKEYLDDDEEKDLEEEGRVRCISDGRALRALD